MTQLEQIRAKLHSMANPTLAVNYKRYLKSQYNFYGLRVPMLRKIAKEYKNLEAQDTFSLFDELWNSGNHEEMNLALFILQNFKKKFTLRTWQFLSSRWEKAKSWDQIDALGTGILGYILADNVNLATEIKNMAMSRNPWVRRLAIVSTSQLIKQNKIQLTLRLAEVLCYDDNLYVQKGAGWMLREAGKKFPKDVREFIMMHLNMKPYAFSYAIEKMRELRQKRKEWEKSMKEKAKPKEL